MKRLQQAFSVVPNFSPGKIEFILEDATKKFESDKRKKLLRWIKTNSARVKIAYSVFPDCIEFFMLLDGSVQGNILFDRRPFKYLIKAPELPKHRLVVTPHVTLSDTMQGTGYATLIYSIYLKRGAVFVGLRQTKAASALWDKVAKRTGAQIVLYDLYKRKLVNKMSSSVVKLMGLNVNETLDDSGR